MIRQYIGARYVTKIYENSLDPSSAEWEGGRSYEPLTLVTYLNSSYLSKKEVPASVGDPASNPSYWTITGAYNGQIVQLQNDITALQNRYVVILGDSYLALNNSTIGQDIADNIGLTLDMHAVNGIGFCHPVNGEVFIDLLDQISDTVKSQCDQIIVYGGLNDYTYSGGDLAAAINSFIAKVKTDFPGVPLLIVGPNASEALIEGPQLETVRNSMLYCSELNAVSYADARHFLTRSPWSIDNAYDADQIHPSAIGQKIIASCISSILKGNDNVNTLMPNLVPIDTGDYVRYSVQPDGIEFDFWNSTSKTYSATNNWLMNLYNFPIELFPLGNTGIFNVYSCSDPNTATDIIGTAIMYRDNSMHRIVWIPSTSYTGYIHVKGKINYYDVLKTAP